MVRFGLKVSILNIVVFNLDLNLMTSGHKKWHGKSTPFRPSFKNGTYFTSHAV